MPRLANLFVEPKATVRQRGTEATPVVEVRVTGLMCDSLCVRRVRNGLGRLPGVEEVRFQEAEDTFLVRFAGAPVTDAQMQAAVDGQVVMPWLRRWLGRIRKGRNKGGP